MVGVAHEPAREDEQGSDGAQAPDDDLLRIPRALCHERVGVTAQLRRGVVQTRRDLKKRLVCRQLVSIATVAAHEVARAQPLFVWSAWLLDRAGVPGRSDLSN